MLARSLWISLWMASSGLAVAQSFPEALPAVPKTLVKSDERRTSGESEIIRTSTGFLLSWADRGVRGGSSSFFVRSFNNNGSPRRPAVLLRDVRFGSGPKLANAGRNRTAVLWHRTPGLGNVIEGGVFDLQSNTLSPVKKVAPGGTSWTAHQLTELPNGRLALAVLDSTSLAEGSRFRVMVSTLDRDLNRLSGPVSVIGNGYKTTQTTSDDLALVASDQRGYVSYLDRAKVAVILRAFTLDGAPVGVATQVNTTSLTPLGFVADFRIRAARLTNGRLLILWEGTENFDGSSLETTIRGRFFSPSGQPDGPDFLVHVKQPDSHRAAEGFAAVALADGQSAVLYRVRNYDNPQRARFVMRTYDAAGKPMGAPVTTLAEAPPYGYFIESVATSLSDGSIAHIFSDGSPTRLLGYGVMPPLNSLPLE